jgi:two-component system KDP operon response regulator KdpE
VLQPAPTIQEKEPASVPDKVLLISENSQWVAKLEGILHGQSIWVDRVRTPLEGLNVFNSYRYDLVLFELNSPSSAGTALIRAISGLSRVPVIVVSGESDGSGRKEILNAGPHYFLPNPPGMGELLASISGALTRMPRETNVTSAAFRSDPSQLRKHEEDDLSGSLPLVRGELTLDHLCRSIRMGPRERGLTHAEYRILRHLMLNERKPVSNEDLLELFYGGEAPPETRVIKVYMARVRAKLRDVTDGEEPIATIRGVGWVFRTSIRFAQT